MLKRPSPVKSVQPLNLFFYLHLKSFMLLRPQTQTPMETLTYSSVILFIVRLQKHYFSLEGSNYVILRPTGSLRSNVNQI